jgi:hypothetical protein
MRRSVLLIGLLAGCDDLQGFGGAAPPLVSIDLAIDGTLPADTVAPKIALIWAQSYLPEPLCVLPPDSDQAALAIAAGCRDPFGFVPSRVGANVDVTDGPIVMTLDSLPSADLLVGDVTARVTYATFALYDDRDGTGTLDLSRSHRLGGRDMGGPDEEDNQDSKDVVLGTSFLSMTQPDQRLAYREGAFVTTAFYPRAGCGDPLPAFSIDAAGGFSAADAIAATLAGMLPQEDPATCHQDAPGAATVRLAVTAPNADREVACEERNTDSSVRFREPPEMAPDLTGRAAACTKLASFGAPTDMPQIEFVISGLSTECKGLTHYVLRGCREDANCMVPDWDIRATPPVWWTCPVTP